MLDYKIINYKKICKKNNTESYLDLMSKTFDKDMPITGGILVVTKDYVARPDLISLVMYKDDKYADIICKINGISNPFELNEGDVLVIPGFDYILNSSKNFDMGPSEFIKEDEDEIAINDISFKKKKSETRTPNEQLVGEKSYVIDKTMGVVFY